MNDNYYLDTPWMDIIGNSAIITGVEFDPPDEAPTNIVLSLSTGHRLRFVAGNSSLRGMCVYSCVLPPNAKCAPAGVEEGSLK